MHPFDPYENNLWEEQRVLHDAQEFFTRRTSLIAWFWDDTAAGGCHPSFVAKCFEAKQLFPQHVKREPCDKMHEILHAEWYKAGQSEKNLPTITPWRDIHGRTAWHIDLGGIPEHQRVLVGRALIRFPICGLWDNVNDEIAYLYSTKIRYLNSQGIVTLDPSDQLVREYFENIEYDSKSVSNFILLSRDQTSFLAYVVPDGMIIEVGMLGDSFSWRASYPGSGIPVRKFEYLGVFAEEEIISHSHATEILMQILADKSKLPLVISLIWRKNEPDLTLLREDIRP